jgi:5'-nucleotidase
MKCKLHKKLQFVKITLSITIVLFLLSCGRNKNVTITIISTNDVHSRVEEFPENDKENGGKAGFARKSEFIKKVRNENKNVLLLDAGDISQGTPYYNMFGASLQFKLMNAMRYDAMTLGNHEFDNGMDSLAQAISVANFPIVCSNYDFSGTPLEGKTVPFLILEKEGVKIGIIGLGVELDGLVSNTNFGKTKYLDPILQTNFYSKILKEKGCDFIIVLSHLGFEYDTDQVSDKVLAQKTKNINLILGGHTHTFMNAPFYAIDLLNSQVTIIQSAYGGIKMTKTVYEF